MPNFFPFTLYATDVHYVSSPKLAERLWRRDRQTVAPNLTWYGVSLEVCGPACVQLHVHDMENSFHGGIGRRILAHTPELTSADIAELKALIVKRQTSFAEDEFHRREAIRVAAEVEAIRREMFEPAA